jgi:predicted nucleic acid-binding protein
VITYLDSSVVLDRILDEPGSAALWRGIDRTVCSVLVETECLRAFDRFRIQGMMDELALVRSRETLFGLMASCAVVEIGRAVLERAALPFPSVIRTLDAIHLATALIYRESTGPLRMATTDRALARASRAMGFEVVGVA